MEPLNNFTEYYKTLSNTELLDILDNPGNYQATAVEAAKKEFETRQLSGEAIDEARKPLLERRLLQQQRRDKTNAIAQKFIDSINPIQPTIRPVEKTRRAIVIVFSALSVYYLIISYKMLWWYVLDIPSSPFESLLLIAWEIILPIGIIAFWKKRRAGWMLLVTYFVVSVIWGFNTMLIYFANIPEETLYPPPSFKALLMQLAVFGGTLYLICRQNMRQIYSISNKEMIGVLAMTVVIGILSVFVLT